MSDVLHSKVVGEGSPILLMHGLFGSGDNLGRLGAHLSQSFEVHLIDLPNHGLSPRSSSISYPQIADDLHTYIQAKKLPKVILFGHSMGGKVAMQFALNYPDLVTKLIVGDIAPVTYKAHHKQIFAGLSAIDLDSIKSRSEADKVMSAHVDNKSVRQFLLKNLSRCSNGNYEWKMNLTAITDNYKNILSKLSSSTQFIGPTLFIGGGLSDYILPEYREHTMSLFPAAKVKIVPGTGHWLHAEKPEVFNSICSRFIKEG